MNEKLKWQVRAAAILLASSALLYLVHYAIYRDIRHMFYYMMGDIAFLPVEVLIVSFVIHRLLDYNEKKIRLEKLNMVIGVFFSEVGLELIKFLPAADGGAGELSAALPVHAGWNEADFEKGVSAAAGHSYRISADAELLSSMKTLLAGKRAFLVNLLESPTLLEHERFTDLLRAVFHAAEELEARTDTGNLPAHDVTHLSGDLVRIYEKLLVQWLDYLRYLKQNYPYLFSLAVRMNPLNGKASPVINS